ncbi:RidA family protein [Chitinasiproducens palmae]|uniref:Reactive intermediate/imine deaminase n=1 Tax=Chitinasiproducens palmae TaxID=1770053 RepID=A0A1H2PLI6_9BURK|nr:RidA family protein [Chitinasiproducens palmae]SDV47313.1 reactive intermediate/imine deaminase [Chitinasiproducens palmae]
MKRVVETDRAPRPRFKYAQACVHGGLIQVAGQMGLTADRVLAGSDVGAQTTQALHNIGAIVEAAGAQLDDVIMYRVYLAEESLFAEMNAAFERFVREPFAARTTVYVGLPKGYLVEIDALAVLPAAR